MFIKKIGIHRPCGYSSAKIGKVKDNGTSICAKHIKQVSELWLMGKEIRRVKPKANVLLFFGVYLRPPLSEGSLCLNVII